MDIPVSRAGTRSAKPLKRSGPPLLSAGPLPPAAPLAEPLTSSPPLTSAAPLPSPLTAPAPLFARVREALRAEILTGALVPGARLPSESALIIRFGVSRITIRQALAELQHAGLIDTLNGKGSYVTRPDQPTSRGPLMGILETMRKRGHRAHGELLSHREVPASRAVAAGLGVAYGTRVGALTVLRHIDDQPAALGTTYLAIGLARRLALVDLRDCDVAVALTVTLGMRPAETRCSVSAVPASAAVARHLGCAKGSPLLRISTQSLDLHRQVLCWSQTDCRGDAMDYRVTLRT